MFTESEKTAEPATTPKKQDTTICSGEQTQEDRPTLGSPKKAAGKSQKRKQNGTTETNHEEQSPSKTAKRRRERKQRMIKRKRMKTIRKRIQMNLVNHGLIRNNGPFQTCLVLHL